MLVILGFAMILVFMTLIMTKRLSPILALILVPTIFGLFAGAGLGIGDMVMDAIASMSSTAALLLFAIIYFGIMIDVGLFDKLVEFILKVAGNDPVKVVLGTALLTGAVSLDGDGSTTFIVVTAAMLPIYQRLEMSPVVLTCVAGLINGTLNIVPWGGPTARASSALQIDANEIFVPMVPSLVAGLLVCLIFAYVLGISERRRLAKNGVAWVEDRGSNRRRDLVGAVAGASTTAGSSAGTTAGGHGHGSGSAASANDDTTAEAGPASANDTDGSAGTGSGLSNTALDPNRATLRPKLFWFNLALTVAVMVLLIIDILPLPYLFMIGTVIALMVNFPKMKDQQEELASHATAIISVVAMVMAAGVLTGIMSGTGMVDAMAEWLVAVIPNSMGPYMAVITGLLSIPMTFFMSNDAFYFGILPVLAETASHFGISASDMARASITGQPVHMQSPLVPAILLLVSLSGVELGDHHKKVLWRALIVALVMLAVGVAVGVIGIG
ncbi:citrate-Mg2+:H+ or citrate-Ca2+:H+ symporter, CitMHS family [Brevibacterium iodinum ATCC 49514]|uniref:Citrate-Mg2+:H+ or citrate-Ca2+:H+ symporter, CitMHS family n=1 Tax=Brevibacterium iodinum ATCC 49514 TaxID=1255616 RepID=A0A2H1K1B5_9MICO|nr:CitMHS family transporter [Brevibacterium iodinum]SMX93338.1 citrate-Mg2+:H+ or citrate-Ca2+:H+ symporter, CitMHS family [Brevibacterium iodinum ATCC 49514]SUW12970.1 Citrate transporter [Brevibacterium iodinum]